MKSFNVNRSFLGAFLLVTCALGISPLSANAADTNLITNPSLEVVDSASALPQGWHTNSWGKNRAQFVHKNTGHLSARSVYVSVTRYTSGDAKWYVEPVSVTPNTAYTISDFYKANVPTRVVVAVFDAAGVPSYYEVGTNVAASRTTWKEFTTSFVTPANAQKMTVFHLIDRNGWLWIDDMSLTAIAQVPGGAVPVNPSLEVALGANSPLGWTPSSWGTNNPSYAYVTNDGHEGTHSVKLTMSGYTDGDAKWVFDPVQLETNKEYRLTAWYKSNVTPHVVAAFIMPDGTEKFFGLPDPVPGPDAATVWQRYSDTFTVPEGVQSVTVFFFLTQNGWVQTDDYTIEAYTPPAYTRPLVTLTFDDGFEENISTALPILAEHNFKTTHCFATEYVEGLPQQVANVQAMAGAGHEICSHSVTHPFLTTLSDAEIDYELSHSKEFLESVVGGEVTTFATPYGDYNPHVNAKIAEHYASHRTTDEGFNTKDNLDPYRLRVQNMTPATTLAEFQGWVNKAKADKTWLIVLYHVITTGTPGAYDTPIADFEDQMDFLDASGVTVATWKDALAETRAQ